MAGCRTWTWDHHITSSAPTHWATLSPTRPKDAIQTVCHCVVFLGKKHDSVTKTTTQNAERQCTSIPNNKFRNNYGCLLLTKPRWGMLTCVKFILGSLPLKYQMQPQNFCTNFNHACKHNCTWTAYLQTFTNEILINLGFVIILYNHLTTYSTGVSSFVCQCSSDIFRLKYK